MSPPKTYAEAYSLVEQTQKLLQVAVDCLVQLAPKSDDTKMLLQINSQLREWTEEH